MTSAASSDRSPFNGHRLVLFDIDGTLLSSGRAARDSVLAALKRVYGWSGSLEDHDFSGKTDPQIVYEIVCESVGPERCQAELKRALSLYLEEFARRLTPDSIRPKPGIPQLLARLSQEPGVALGLLTGNLERGARMKLEPPGFNPYFPFGAFGSDSPDRYSLPAIALERARAHTGRDFEGKAIVVVGDSVHDVACGRNLGVRSIAVATGPTPAARLEAEKPDALFPDFSNVEAAIKAIVS